MSSSVHTILEQPRPDALPIAGDFPLDPNVIAQFPPGTKVLAAHRFGHSAWTITARLLVQLPDQTHTKFFLKCATDLAGKIMMEGEFHSMTALHNTMPSFAPKPYAWGKFDAPSPEMYFFIAQFIDMNDRVPDPSQLCSKLATLHRTSVSPTGKFGMHITTCQGRTPQHVAWESSWTTFFTRLLQHVVDADMQMNGFWDDLDVLSQRILQRVVPRLIGALEQDGRSVKPCLVHADLWEGNSGTSYETGDIYVFDAAAFYAHNEFEVGNWRCHYNKIHNKIYTRTYLKHFGPSEPKEEWDDRNRMYCVYYNVIYSINHASHGKAVRQTAYDDMYYLVDKYAPFVDEEGPPRLDHQARATLSAERDHTVSV